MATTYIEPPASFRIATFSVGMLDGLSQNRGTYSGAERRLETGGEIWIAGLDLIHMTPEQSLPVQALCHRLMRADAALVLGAPSGAVQLGTTRVGLLTLNGPAGAGATDVDVSGLGAGKTLLAGSYINFGTRRLHQVIEDATANGSGDATLTILPRLRQNYSNGSSLKINPANIKSIWRLNASPQFTIAPHLFQPVRLELYEAVEV